LQTNRNVAAELKRSAKAVEGRAYMLRISLKRVNLRPKAKGNERIRSLRLVTAWLMIVRKQQRREKPVNKFIAFAFILGLLLAGGLETGIRRRDRAEAEA
jgi:hypothetical protein